MHLPKAAHYHYQGEYDVVIVFSTVTDSHSSDYDCLVILNMMMIIINDPYIPIRIVGYYPL